MSWKDNFALGKEIVLATTSKDNIPNAIIVVSLGFLDDYTLLIADCQMDTTLKNLKKNHSVSIIAGYLRMKGKADIFARGKYFDLAVQKTKSGPEVKNAIVVDIDEIYDLDKGVAMME